MAIKYVALKDANPNVNPQYGMTMEQWVDEVQKSPKSDRDPKGLKRLVRVEIV
jgi:hypothetical protein